MNQEEIRKNIQATQNGSLEAFNFLIIEYQDRIYHAIYRILGDVEESLDISQETFMKAYKSIKKFQGDSHFYTWLFRIATNTTLTYLQKKKKRRTYSLEGIKGNDEEKKWEHKDSKQETAPEILEQKDRHLRVHEKLLELPEEHRVILVLKDLEGLSYDKISSILELPKGTVKSRIFRAREALKEKLKDLVV